MTPRRVLLVEDQRAFRDALSVAIDCEDDLRCVGAATDVEGGLALLRDGGADVVVMDFDLPGVDGIEGTRRVKALRPEVSVVVLTALDDVGTYLRALGAGADVFLAKDRPLEEIVAALRGELPSAGALDREASMRVRAWATAGIRRRDLTDREREVLAMLAEGIDPQTIARLLGIRVHTARGYVKNILMKLGAHSQLEAVAIARRHGLVDGESSATSA